MPAPAAVVTTSAFSAKVTSFMVLWCLLLSRLKAFSLPDEKDLCGYGSLSVGVRMECTIFASFVEAIPYSTI